MLKGLYSSILTPARYAFRSTEKAALQEIGPRFTLKLRWLKKGIPAVQNFGASAPPLQLATDEPEEEFEKGERIVPPVTDEYEWQWRVSTLFFWRWTCLIGFLIARSGSDQADIFPLKGFVHS